MKTLWPPSSVCADGINLKSRKHVFHESCSDNKQRTETKAVYLLRKTIQKFLTAEENFKRTEDRLWSWVCVSETCCQAMYLYGFVSINIYAWRLFCLFVRWMKKCDLFIKRIQKLDRLIFFFPPPTFALTYSLFIKIMALNEEHTQSIVDYLRFARYKRTQRVKAVDTAFVELKESRWLFLFVFVLFGLLLGIKIFFVTFDCLFPPHPNIRLSDLASTPHSHFQDFLVEAFLSSFNLEIYLLLVFLFFSACLWFVFFYADFFFCICCLLFTHLICRLNDETFTSEEVGSMLDGLSAMLHGDVESELIDSAHSNVILLRQVCTTTMLLLLLLLSIVFCCCHWCWWCATFIDSWM